MDIPGTHLHYATQLSMVFNITLFLQMLTFYHVNDVKIHISEQHLKDLGSHF